MPMKFSSIARILMFSAQMAEPIEAKSGKENATITKYIVYKNSSARLKQNGCIIFAFSKCIHYVLECIQNRNSSGDLFNSPYAV